MANPTKRAGPGRPKGSVNKTTAIAKDALAYAFDALGGQEALYQWAKSNPSNLRVFYTHIWPKLLPLQVAGDIDHNLKVSGALAWQPPQ
jgi:hypothetical protein